MTLGFNLPRRAATWLALFAILQAFVLPAAAEVRVVTTIKPIHALVSGIIGHARSNTDNAPYLIVKGTASPHAYAMKPSDAAALQNADIIFQIGGAFEQFLASAIRNSRSGATIIKLASVPGINRLPYRKDLTWSGGLTHSSHGHTHSHNESASSSFDPHIWLDPSNAIKMTSAIAHALSRAQPNNAQLYEDNAAALSARIRRLELDIARQLQTVRTKPFMVFHDAFQYFEAAFRLTAIGAISLDETRPPGAGRVRVLQRLLVSHKVVCVFAEPQFEPKIIGTLLTGTTVHRGILDPIGSSLKAGTESYFQMMQNNAAALAGCLADG